MINVVPESTYPIEAQFQVFQDINNEYSFESIADLPGDQWQTRSSSDANFGFQDSYFWLQTLIANNTDEVKNFVVDLNYVYLDEVVFKATRQDGSVIELTTGDTKPFRPRHIDHPGNLFNFQLAPREQLPITIRVQTEGSMILPLRVWEEKAFFENATTELQIHFFYYGLVFTITLLNLAVFFSLRERLYLYYALAIAGYLLFFATNRGYLHQLLIPDAPDLNSRLFLISMPMLALFSLLFARNFLRTASHSPRLDWAIKAMIAFESFNLAMAVFGDYDATSRLSAVGAILLFSVLFLAGPISWYNHRRAGIFFTIAWSPLTFGVFATSARASGYLPNNFWTEYAMQIGSGLEAVILSLALAERLYREREKKIQAQKDSLLKEKQRNMTQALLTESVSRDPVTQLSNRNRFEWLVNDTLKANPGKRYFLTVARISRLEEITRTLGLSTADHVLRVAASRLSEEQLATGAAITHTNGEGREECLYQLSRNSFGVFTDMDAFEQDPDKFYAALKRLTNPVTIEGISIDLAPHFGCALYPNHGNKPDQLIRNALIALKVSSHSKGMMGIFQKSMDIYDEKRLTLATRLREALDKDALQLHYQPKVDINTGAVVGMEGLARWIDPERGFVPPDEFIPLAEQSDLINRLTLWAFERALKDYEQLHSTGYDGSISINISARDLLVANLDQQFKAILDRYTVPSDKIYLELTETGAMEDKEAGIASLNALVQLGLKIAIDDFGTGYSSLSYLQSLPATEIKLDRSLIENICTSDSSAVIVKTSIDMIHALGYNLVAEGVEDEASVNKLMEYHCDCFQGFWCCKPLPLADVTQWLENRQ
ncbi:MAG: hypothetical protein AseanaTS_24670 [Candidatus Pelagadaptatus aseana]